MLDKVLDWFYDLLDLLSTKKCYTSLFKSGVFLWISLFASGQVVLVNVLPYEKEAFALMFKVEAAVKNKIEHKSPEELKCSLNQPKVVYNDCKNSKYLFGLSSSLITAFTAWTELLFLLMYFIFTTSILGFVFRK